MYTHAVVMVECKMFVIILQTGKNSVCVCTCTSQTLEFSLLSACEHLNPGDSGVLSEEVSIELLL